MLKGEKKKGKIITRMHFLWTKKGHCVLSKNIKKNKKEKRKAIVNMFEWKAISRS